MDYEDFEKLLSMDYDESPPKLPSRVDSCPPTPQRCDSFSNQPFDFPGVTELLDPVTPLSAFSSEGTVKRKAEDSEEDFKEVEAKGKAKRPNKVAVSCNTVKKTVEKKALRAERNRKFAKESRDRKRRYVENLEDQVKELTREVDYYKQRLKKYEFIDTRNKRMGYELYGILARVHREMQNNKQSANTTESFNQVFANIFQQECKKDLEQQRAAVKMLTKEMLQILIPFSKRISMWFAENEFDVFDPDRFMKLTNSRLSYEQAKVIADYVKQIYPNKKSYYESRLLTANVAKEVKKIAKELIGCQVRIQAEYKKLDRCLAKSAFTLPSPELLEIFAKFTSNLAINPELRNYCMESMNEIDSKLDNLTLEGTRDVERTAETIAATK
eukprot:TRINITY_DN849_c0_g2_i2.p1 TRINITY_DN849_c0_g2~~TRINITY_DN849_c0_g2_i2.p1  ORF type:complete len:385 (+),score=89.70 TRINITY_DN849_c0_g2_i2:160-1314(+)